MHIHHSDFKHIVSISRPYTISVLQLRTPYLYKTGNLLNSKKYKTKPVTDIPLHVYSVTVEIVIKAPSAELLIKHMDNHGYI